jgi:hypothetical protein
MAFLWLFVKSQHGHELSTSSLAFFWINVYEAFFWK